jgi:diacylglycerol kinase (ATP)
MSSFRFTSHVQDFGGSELNHFISGRLEPIFIICNPTAGSRREGESLMCFDDKTMHFQLENMEQNFAMILFDISDGTAGCKPRFCDIKYITDSPLYISGEKILRIIVAGGDGTVLWTITELEEHGVCLDLVAIGTIPIGVQNNLSASTGFGSIVENVLLNLREFMEEFVHADLKSLDIWNLDFHVNDNGSFSRVVNGKKIIITDKHGETLPVLSKRFLTCFSIGVESRIGLGFDKHQVHDQFFYDILVFYESMKKAMFKKTLPVKGAIEWIKIGSYGLNSQILVFYYNSI